MMNKRTTRHRAFDPDPNAPTRCCDMPGCDAAAGYRAPRARDQLNDYFWFCLEHVRAYNANWDYYRGMTPGQIESHLRADTAWQRPTWKMGHRGAQVFDEEDVLDPLDILGAARQNRARAHRGSGPSARPADNGAPEPLREPLDTLGLAWPVSMDDLKTRYKSLARLHHPDANGGDRAAEERLKSINVAYSAVRQHLTRADAGTVG
ncbi:molecular chaperone DnaJ [Ameyamaea chiangmaiensis NBRC 103196]|uniref:J domain-containing protein n=1 Tax=Ameyamaea chiangmaiensis TaxID=442969 RepID=A0A850PDG7_9PROT|nr:J domain-containing protein [Ameyamaea chiangmaiensis]MBS4073752.1 J domain-containing protein [Ameyamaea chiangmaiensis]NVN39982.1 J domain-containing protein [Ameyamaea chiangmaiensis]GBQ68585.1 molecular chaperone DnaJ [Ameyamaea chiangmaiensis NBRC 103196]